MKCVQIFEGEEASLAELLIRTLSQNGEHVFFITFKLYSNLITNQQYV